MHKKFLILFFAFPFFITACLPPTPSSQKYSITKETVKEVEKKVEIPEQKEQRIDLEFSKFNGYFIKNDIKLYSGMNFFTINSPKVLEKYLAKSKKVLQSDANPDFKKNLIVLLAMPNSKDKFDINISQIYSIGSDIFINYEVTESADEKVFYFTSSFQAYTIARPQIVTNLCFIDQGNNKTTIPFGNRNSSSPANLHAMLKYHTGTYKGVIPSEDSSDISMTLTLEPDYTFNLKQYYLSNAERVFETTGKWAPTEDLSSFVLNYDKPKYDQMRFYFLNMKTIEKLDMNGESINQDLYKLKK